MLIYETIKSKTDALYYPNRMFKAVKAFSKHKGMLYGLGAGMTILTSSAIFALLLYPCYEGVARSFMIVAENISTLSRIRPLGDAGGWNTLPIINLLAYKAFYESIIREGEILRIEAICKKWIANNQDSEKLDENQLYDEIFETLSDFNKRRLFPKTLASLHLTTLSLCPVTDTVGKVHQKRQLLPYFSSINQDIENSSYLSQATLGFQMVGTKSILSKTLCLTMSVALPIILITNSILSLIGEVGLINDVYVNQTDLEDAGHVSEWPINAIGALSLAYYLHRRYLLNEGLFVILKNSYTQELQKIQNDQKLYNVLSSNANEDLKLSFGGCNQMKYTSEYKFKKL